MSETNNVGLRPDLLAIANFIQPGEKVLDLGCGDGVLLRHLIDGRQITGRGIELSEQGVLACVRKGLSVRQGNLDEGLGDYPDDSFDTVILSQTLPYLDDPAFIICEMLRVSRRAIVSFANWGHWRCRIGLLLTGRTPLAPGLPQPWYTAPRARPLTVRDFIDFCKNEGIKIDQSIYLGESNRTLRAARLGENMRVSIAIFEVGKLH
ncbi:MAG: methionine biosynthesis protein MetW [Chloroflexi bacterium]|nr:methionine biosynthesis protein MetW [Chloroflexota bacterium]